MSTQTARTMLFARATHDDATTAPVVSTKTLCEEHSAAYVTGRRATMKTFPGRRMPKKTRDTIGVVELKQQDSLVTDPFLGVTQDPIPVSQQYFSVAVAGITRIRFGATDPQKKAGQALNGVGVLVSDSEWDAAAGQYVADVHLSHGQDAGAGSSGPGLDFSSLSTTATMGDDGSVDGPVPVIAAAAAAAASPAEGAPAPVSSSTGGAMDMDMDAKASAARRQVRAELAAAEFEAVAATPKPTTARRKRNKPKA